MMNLHKPIEDKTIRGLIAGITAGLLKDIPAVVFYFLINHPHPTFWDYMSLLAMGRIPKTWDEYLFSIIVQVLWCTILATVFVYFRPVLKSRHYILHGAGFGLLIWLLIRALVYFHRAPELIHSNPSSAYMNMLISISYGIMVAVIDHRLQ